MTDNAHTDNAHLSPTAAPPAFAPPAMRGASHPTSALGRSSWPSPRSPKPSAPSTGVRLAWIVPGALLALATLGWGTFNVLTVLAHEVRTEQATFPAADVTAIEITSANGSVTVTGGAGDEIAVTARINDGWKDSDVEMRIVDGVLEIDSSCPFFGQPWCSTNFAVSLPADIPVRVDASNGSVAATGMHGAIDLDTDNGNVEVDDVSGAIRITNDNGRIVGRRIGTATVDASTSNGRIDLSFSNPPDDVRARTSNGRIEVAVPDDDTAYRVVLSTRNGSENIEVRTDPSSLHTIDLSSGNGSITVNHPG